MATKMTKAQLLDENNALRNEINTLRLMVAAAEQARDDAQAHVRATMDSEARCEPTLAQRVDASARNCEALQAEADAELAAVAANIAARQAARARTQSSAYVMPAWQVARAQQMAAAKQAAMAMRCVIKVEA